MQSGSPLRSLVTLLLLSVAFSAPARGADAGGFARDMDAGAGLDAGTDAAAEDAAVLTHPPDNAQPLPPMEPPPAPILAPLPDVVPDPALAPVLESRVQEEPVPPAERRGVVIRTILGLLALMVLAYLGGHRRVLEWEERLGISQLITTGFPFVLMGVLARHPKIGVLSDGILSEISPLLRLGLGWIGFVAGFRFEARMFEGLPRRTAQVVALSTLFPFALVVGACASLLFFISDGVPTLRDPVFLRDALILGTAGAMAAVSSARGFSDTKSKGVLERVIRLEELAGVIGLALVAAFFRPASTSWQMPGAAWVLLTVGLGATLGVLVYAILQRSSDGTDFLILTLGSISFAAGAAAYLLLSSIVVAFTAGVLLANFPGRYHQRLRAMLLGLERPIYLVSLVIVGALWQVQDWRGWLLMPVFMLTRLAGKWLATQLALRGGELELGRGERRALAMPPLGPLSIAIVVNAQLLYPGGSMSLIVSAVLGGAVLTELFLQIDGRRRAGAQNGAEAP